MNKPIAHKMVSAAKIAEAAQEYLDFFEGEDFHEDRISDYENYIVETVMQEIFGANVYDWINSQYD